MGSASQEHRRCLVSEAKVLLGNRDPGQGRGLDFVSTEQILCFTSSGNS